MIHSILVPLDGSEFGEQVLPLAAEIARRHNATLHLVKVHTLVLVPEAVAMYTAAELESTSEIAAYLNELVAKLSVTGPAVRLHTVVLEGAVIEALEAYVATNRVDLIVMTTHGRGGLSCAWLGSVADELVRRVATPVLLLRPSDDPAQPPAPASFDRLLVVLDGTPVAEAILEPAVELARTFGASLTLARVVPLTPAPGRDAADRALAERVRTAATDYLHGRAVALREQGVTVNPFLLESEHAAVALLDAVRTGHFDLIAVATHGRGELTRLFLGSVADKIIRGTTAAVLVRRALPKPDAQKDQQSV